MTTTNTDHTNTHTGEIDVEYATDEQLLGIYAAAEQEAVEAQERAGRPEGWRWRYSSGPLKVERPRSTARA